MIFPSRALRGTALAVAVAAAAGCAMIDRMTGESAARPLRQSGAAAEAEILRVWDTGITLNDDPVIGMEVEVQPAEGEAFQAEIPRSVISRIAIPRFQPGERIAVRYDPRDPRRVALDDPPFPAPADPRDERNPSPSEPPGPGAQTSVSFAVRLCARRSGDGGDGGSSAAEFRVTDPEGRRYELAKPLPAPDDWLCVRFPDDFADAAAALPGQYRYEIRTGGAVSERGELTLRRR